VILYTPIVLIYSHTPAHSAIMEHNNRAPKRRRDQVSQSVAVSGTHGLFEDSSDDENMQDVDDHKHTQSHSQHEGKMEWNVELDDNSRSKRQRIDNGTHSNSDPPMAPLPVPTMPQMPNLIPTLFTLPRGPPQTTHRNSDHHGRHQNDQGQHARPSCAHWIRALDNLCVMYKQREMIAHDNKRIHTRLDLITNPSIRGKNCLGDDRIMNINKAIHEFGLDLSVHQEEFIKLFIQASLPHIYGKDWNANMVRVLKEHNLSKIHYDVCVQTARRWGKTECVGIYLAAMLLFRPGIRIAIFSTGKRASAMITAKVIRNIKAYRDGERRIVSQTEEYLAISAVPMEKGASKQSASAKASLGLPDTSHLHFYPSSVDSKYCICAFKHIYIHYKWTGHWLGQVLC